MSGPQDVMALLTRCVDLPAAERVDFARRESGGDAELLAAVVRLLEMYEQGTDFLESCTDLPHRSWSSGDPGQIDSYRVLERLGEGGFGAVYLAEQQDPIQRRVALKLLKRGMDSTSVLRRFDVERQALAQMDHANVASVFDAGVAPDGRPYFVMQYVPGHPICEYADEQHLSTRARLRLFQGVCSGVQHAHQKGIIHRDLKPANVLVSSVGDEHKLDAAEPYHVEALNGRRRVLGDEHPHTMAALNNMGDLLKRQGRLPEAKRYFGEALDVSRRVRG